MVSKIRFSLSVLAGALFLFLSGALLYGWLLAGYFHQVMGHLVRSPEDFRLGVVAVEKLVQATLLAVAARELPAHLGGLRRGLLLGALVALPWGLSLYGNFPVAGSTAAVLTALDLARVLGAVALIGLVQRGAVRARAWSQA